jgi:HEPN domain-containing protein
VSSSREREAAERRLVYGHGDLASAEALSSMQAIDARNVCSLAQQAAEKALKAVLVLHGIDFPRTHDLDRLAGLLPEGSRLGHLEAGLSELTAWVIEARYPGDWPDATDAGARSALELARGVVEAAKLDFDSG